jgi:hypothetical protein
MFYNTLIINNLTFDFFLVEKCQAYAVGKLAPESGVFT